MTRKLLRALFCFTLLLAPVAAQSQDASAEARAETVEPILTEETLPNELGEWDLRVSCVYERDRTESPRNCLRTQVFFGVAPRWGVELEAALPNLFGDRPEEPRGELETTLKYLLRAPGERGPALVLALETSFALSRPESSEEGLLGLQPTFAFLQTVGRTTWQGNVGYAVKPGGSGPEKKAVYNLSLAVPWRHGRWHALAELAGSSGDGSSAIAFSPGLKYGFGGGNFVALGLPVGLTSSSPDIGLVFQVQFSLGKAGE
jgi:hypothetical protein